MFKKVLAYLISCLATYVIATVFVSHFNIESIETLGYSVALSDRIRTTLNDIMGMTSVYLPLIVIALLLAWCFTGLIIARLINHSRSLYALAGFTALISIHLILYWLFNVNGIAPTKTLPGLLSQGFAGAIGGWLFYAMAYKERVNQAAP